MKNSTKQFFVGIAIVLVVLAGSYTVFSVVTENENSQTTATGQIMQIFTGNTAKAPTNPDYLSYCERVKLSRVKQNYDKIVVIDNNPEGYCEVDSDQVIYNYNKATVIN